MTHSENNYTVQELWSIFLKKNPDNRSKDLPESFHFCDNKEDADVCADLVVKGIKQATAPSLWWFEKNKMPIPKVGDQYVVTDWSGHAQAVIETTQVELVPYNQVTAEFARIEGEGDQSLNFWREVHKEYYNREMEPFGEKFNEEMIIVCEQFKVIFTP